MSIATLTLDALRTKRAFDPTNTIGLRRAFQAAAQLRLRQLRAAMRVAVVDHDVLALGGSEAVMAYHPTDVRLRAFNAWLDSTARAIFAAHDWLRSWVEKAWASGVRAAAAEVGLPAAPLRRDHEHLVQLARIELDGIIAALVQRVSREAELIVALSNIPRSRAFWRLGMVFDEIGKARVSMLAETITVKAHNAAKLEMYGAIGVEQVGITPERLLVPLHRDTMVFDARRRKRHRRGYGLEELVGVLTAGDDKVCQRCQDMAEDAPYTLDEARDLIPRHPRCRCAVFPWRDPRFKGEDTADARGRYIRGRGGRFAGSEPGSHEEKPSRLVKIARPPSEDVSSVAAASFEFSKVLGNRTMSLSELRAGVSQGDDPHRVIELVNAIKAEGGYFSRPIVDQHGNVLEGQHRVLAAHRMGETAVPVVVIKDLAHGQPVDEMRAAIKGVHPDQAHQLMQYALEAIDESGSAVKALEEFGAPQGFESQWNAALKAAMPAMDVGGRNEL